MARYKHFSYDQGVMVPIQFSKQIMPGTIEHTIHWLVYNRIDTSPIAVKYKNDVVGAPAYDPALLLKIILFAYSRGIVSSRMIMRACRENIVFRCATVKTSHTPGALFVSMVKIEDRLRTSCAPAEDGAGLRNEGVVHAKQQI